MTLLLCAVEDAAMRLKCCILTPMFMPIFVAMELEGASGRRDELVGWTTLPCGWE